MQQNPLYKIASFLSYAEAKGLTESSYLPCWSTDKNASSIIGRMRSFYTGSRPINDNKIKNFIENIDMNDLHTDMSIDKKLQSIIYDWMSESKNINLQDLQKFNYFDSTFGTTQCIDCFFLKNQNQQIGITKNEYWYVKEISKDNKTYHLDVDNIVPNSFVMVSVPHSYLGENMNELILKAKSQNCYVAVDLTYAPLCTQPIEINFDCVDECWISLNKTWPLQTLRNGFRFAKKQIDDPISWMSSMPLTNRIGGGVVYKVMQNFSINYIVENYYQIMEKIIKHCNLQQTNILTVAQSHDYKNYFTWTASKFNQNHGERINLSSVIENYNLLKTENLL